MKMFAIQNIKLFPSLKHIVLMKYPSTGYAADGFMTLNSVTFTKQYLDGSEK
jgi:hypothetical protein